MAVTPNSVIRLLSNVPLDAAHRNTLYFSSVSAQTSYFSGQTAFTFSQYSYQRRERSVLVEASADALYQCNYMMYQNSSYTNKWFYAFIDSINYVNDNCAEVVYTFDPLQSWYTEWALGSCFVERQHSRTDEIGDNILADNLALGDYYIESVDSFNQLSRIGLRITVAATFDKNFEAAQGNVAGCTYSGLHFNQFQITDVDGVNQFLEEATTRQLSEGIVSIFISPIIDESNLFVDSPFLDSFSVEKNYGNFQGYLPKNNKLYTYPYNCLYVYTDDGNSIDYAYEYFDGDEATFNIYTNYGTAPELVSVPTNYKGAAINLNEKISLGGFAQCAYNIDSYKAWLAQNGEGFRLNALQSTFSAGMGAVSGATGAASSIVTGNVPGVVGSVMSGISSLFNVGIEVQKNMNTINVMQRMPNAARGSSTGGATFTNSLKNFYFANAKITSQYAQMIDDFWTMYGYPMRRVTVPNVRARSEYTYIKTIGCFVKGGAPAADLQKIASYFDNGITFWVNPSNVGNYSVTNTPLGGTSTMEEGE